MSIRKRNGVVFQRPLPVIHHKIEEEQVVEQRAIDGYVNATDMCKIVGKLWNDYARNQTTKKFIMALSVDTGIPVSMLIQVIRGGYKDQQGTWVHPQVAINLAIWLSPEFAVKVSKWVFDWLSGYATRRAQLPDHVRRYVVNRHKIPPTHFSMLDQMTLKILAPLEEHGYILPKKMMPDIALGLMFSKWLRMEGYDPDTFPTYEHKFLDNRPIVNARLYPNELLTEFNQQLEMWLTDGRAQKYFQARDLSALGPLEEVLLSLPPPDDADHSNRN